MKNKMLEKSARYSHLHILRTAMGLCMCLLIYTPSAGVQVVCLMMTVLKQNV